jgi:outer membrane protein TolC
VSWNRVFTRTEVKLIQPVFDFGKISAGIAAAEAGVVVAQQRGLGSRADIELNVRKAYYGLKFAREVIDMLEEGSSYVDEAQTKLEKDLASGTGNVSVTDKLRRHRARRAGRGILEAKRLQGIARDSLRTLLGPRPHRHRRVATIRHPR